LEVRRADVEGEGQESDALILCDLDSDHALDRIEMLSEIIGKEIQSLLFRDALSLVDIGSGMPVANCEDPCRTAIRLERETFKLRDEFGCTRRI
jgi:hypothetical protein